MKDTLKYLLLGLVMTGLSVFVVINGNTIWDWLGVILFGLLSLVYLLKLLYPNAKFLKNLKTASKKIDNRPFNEIYNDNGIFEYQDNGIKINFESGQMEIKWDDIQTVFGYKADLYTTDCICADVFCSNDKSFRVTEETTGWFQFLIHLKERFPNIDKTWEMEIAIPAFETKLTLVYDRENRTLEEATKKHYKD